MHHNMPTTLDEAIADLPQEQQDKIALRTQELIRQTSLRELRRALGITQKQLSDALKISQAALSKQEQRQEIQVSTLCGVVKALGGKVEITAYFPGDRTVRLMA
jgi:DNA-binding transcriptional regulator YiaG